MLRQQSVQNMTTSQRLRMSLFKVLTATVLLDAVVQVFLPSQMGTSGSKPIANIVGTRGVCTNKAWGCEVGVNLAWMYSLSLLQLTCIGNKSNNDL